MQSAPTLLTSWAEASRVIVGVCPTSAFHRRRRLFHALERVLPVRFTPRRTGEWRGLRAAILFGHDSGSIEPARNFPAFIIEEQDVDAGEPGQTARFADVPQLDRRLRRQQMECVSASTGLTADGVDCVELASTADRLLWQTSSTAPRVDRVGVSPADLESGESLRDHLRAGRYLQLLPLFDFLREISGDGLRNGKVRATFII